jgi:LysR family transcriptional regulator, regulator for metE and metH
MDLEVRHLRLVRAVAETGSLTRAGIALNLTQSALSHQLRDIESRLGTALFLRIGKRLTLTPAGERLLRSAHEILTQLERTEDALRQLAGDQRGLLRLTTECYTCYHWLPAVLKRYGRVHSGVEVRIDVGATNTPVASLLEGQIDLALITSPVRDRRIVTRPLFDDEYVAIVAPKHRLAQKDYLEPKDFATETLPTYSPREETTVYQRLLAPAGVTPLNVLQVQITEAIVELAKAGLGIGALSRWAVAPHVRAGTLRALPLTARGFKRVWSAATLKDLSRVGYVREFIDLLIEDPPFGMPLATARTSGKGVRGTFRGGPAPLRDNRGSVSRASRREA